jgi:hypothetical protein
MTTEKPKVGKINYGAYAKGEKSRQAGAANETYKNYKPPGTGFEEAEKLTGGASRHNPNRIICNINECTLIKTKKGGKAVVLSVRVLAVQNNGFLASAVDTIKTHPTYNKDWIVYGEPNAVGTAVRAHYAELDNVQRGSDLIDPFISMGLAPGMYSAGDESIQDPWLIFTRPGHGKTFELLSELESDPRIMRSLAVLYAQFRGEFLSQEGSVAEVNTMIQDAWVDAGAAEAAKMISARPQYRRAPYSAEMVLAEMSHLAVMPAFNVEETDIEGVTKRVVDAKFFKRLWESTVFVIESFVETYKPKSGEFAGVEKMTQRTNFKPLSNAALAEYAEAGHEWAARALEDREEYLPQFGLVFK